MRALHGVLCMLQHTNCGHSQQNYCWRISRFYLNETCIQHKHTHRHNVTSCFGLDLFTFIISLWFPHNWTSQARTHYTNTLTHQPHEDRKVRIIAFIDILKHCHHVWWFVLLWIVLFFPASHEEQILIFSTWYFNL